MLQLTEPWAVPLTPFSAEQALQYLQGTIIEELEQVLAVDGIGGVQKLTDRLGCLLAAVAAQHGGAEGLKHHLDNSERYGSAQLFNAPLWTTPRLP